ncbi:secretory vesicle transport protein, putative [Candida dubliniensis CD36]|uniref:Secretory vesicle transport protein, putative n=1 Tax=Candida dubliniensis (strain CD36 / ATCC MYA-646 / CBS 7987 / NCPF 3949 / NRRL Y-17841) TaxID=573826 RepID=B9WIW8_CANDC|nr:secretory vesicle transport protein, putative [Candida dubliniensis CD36]CAX41186.1 secretory vesicle transport protein, putative [Candida dubliniensis CD36]
MSAVYYKKLDTVQFQIYDLFNSLIQLSNSEDESVYKASFDDTVQEIDSLLIAFKDLLRLLRPKDKSNKLNTYELKFHSLKQKLRELQVFINDQQQDKLHEYRVKHFRLQDSPVDTLNNESARDQLFASRSIKKTQKETEASINQQIVNQNKSITKSLQASRQLLSAGILQSELNIENIDQQTKDLYKLNEGFIQFNDLLNRSKKIVKFIEKQDKADRQRIYLSMGFFILCCSWVVYRRILRRPLKIFLWSFFKIFNIFNWLLGGGRSKGLSATGVLVSSVIAATTEIDEYETTKTFLETFSGMEDSNTAIDTLTMVVESLTTSSMERIVDEL